MTDRTPHEAVTSLLESMEYVRAQLARSAVLRAQQVDAAGGEPVEQVRALAGHFRDLASQYAKAAELGELAVERAEACRPWL